MICDNKTICHVIISWQIIVPYVIVKFTKYEEYLLKFVLALLMIPLQGNWHNKIIIFPFRNKISPAEFLPILQVEFIISSFTMITLYIETSALRLLALRELLFTAKARVQISGLRPSVNGKVTSDNWNLRNLRYNKNICHMILALITSESAYPIIQVEALELRFWDNS